MRLLIVTEQVTTGKLIGALLCAAKDPVVTATMVFDSFEAPLSADADLLTKLVEFQADAYLFLYTGCLEIAEVDIRHHRDGWRERVGVKPTIFVIEDTKLWAPGNFSSSTWCDYLMSNPSDNDEATIGEELAKFLRRCKMQVRAAK
jgi:hypothetical protein